MNTNINLFDNQEAFGGKYTRINEQSLSDEQKQQISSITIESRSGDNGSFNVMCFHMMNGQSKSFYLNNRNSFEVGDMVDPDSVKLYQLMDKDSGEVQKMIRAEGEIIL